VAERTLLLVSDVVELHHAFELALSFAGGITPRVALSIQEALQVDAPVEAVLLDADTWGLPGVKGAIEALRGRFDGVVVVVLGGPTTGEGADARFALPASVGDVFAQIAEHSGVVLPRVPMSLSLPAREEFEEDVSGERTLADGGPPLVREGAASERPAQREKPEATSARAIFAPPLGVDAPPPPRAPDDGQPSLLSRVERLKRTLDATKRTATVASAMLPPTGAENEPPPVVEETSRAALAARSTRDARNPMPTASELDVDSAVDEALDRTAEGFVSDIADALATEGESESKEGALASSPLSLDDVPAPPALDDVELAVAEADRGLLAPDAPGAIDDDPWGDRTTRSLSDERPLDGEPSLVDAPSLDGSGLGSLADLPSLPDGTPVDGAKVLLRTGDPTPPPPALDDEPPAPPDFDDDDVAEPTRRFDVDESLFSREGVDEGAPEERIDEPPPPPPLSDDLSLSLVDVAPAQDQGDVPLFSDDGPSVEEPTLTAPVDAPARVDAAPPREIVASTGEEHGQHSDPSSSAFVSSETAARALSRADAASLDEPSAVVVRAAVDDALRVEREERAALERSLVDRDRVLDEARADLARARDELSTMRAALAEARAARATDEDAAQRARALFDEALAEERARGDDARAALTEQLTESRARGDALVERILKLENERKEQDARAARSLDENTTRLEGELAAAVAASTIAHEEHEAALALRARAHEAALAERVRAVEQAAEQRERAALEALRETSEAETMRVVGELERAHEAALERALAEAERRAQADAARAVDEAVRAALSARADEERAHLEHVRGQNEATLEAALRAVREEAARALASVEARLDEERAAKEEERAARAQLLRALDEERAAREDERALREAEAHTHARAREAERAAREALRAEHEAALEEAALAARALLDDEAATAERAREALRAAKDEERARALATLTEQLDAAFAERWRAVEREMQAMREEASAQAARDADTRRLLEETLAKERADALAQSELLASERRSFAETLQMAKDEHARLVREADEREKARERERALEQSAFAEERARLADEHAKESAERARAAVEEELRRREQEEAQLFAKLAFRRGQFDAVYDDAREPLAVVGESAWEEAERVQASANEDPFRADTGAPLDPDVARPGKLVEPLAGTFGDGEVAALLFSAFHLGTTGRLVLTDESGAVRALYLENGEPVAFTSTLARDRPEEILLRKGLITTRQHHALRAGPALSARKLCGLLVEERAMKADELFAAIRGVLTEQTMSILEWDGGRFSFDEERAASHDRVRLAQSMDALLAEAVRRKLSDERLWRIVGGPLTVLARDDRAPRMPPLSPLELESATRFDGVRALEDVILDVGGPAEIPLRTAFLLVSCGALRVVARGLPRDADERARIVEDAIAIDRARIEDRLRLTREGDYFTILGVAPDATVVDVERAATTLRQRFAPGRFDAPAFRDHTRALVEICQVIDEARGVLSDLDLRRAYQDRRARRADQRDKRRA